MGRRRKTSKVDLLSEVTLFSSCNARELSKIAALADEVDVPVGTKLTYEGKPGREFFVIADGKAVVAIRGRRLATLGPGDFFGEMALLDNAPRVATVTAETQMSLYVVEARSFASLLSDAPTVARKVMQGLAQRLRELERSPTH